MFNNFKRPILFILILAWMVIIFIFSSQNVEKSKSLSSIITNVVTRILYKDKELTKKETSKIHHNVRKSAHFTFYFVSGILFLNFYNQFEISNKKKLLFSQASGTIFAITDEFHQLFVQGRGSSLRDVFIDFSGVFFGMILMHIIMKACSKTTGL